MNYIWIGLAGGAAAFAHCLGMCGGFVLHLSQGQDRWRALGRQLLWLGGKAFTYVFLGALAGFFGRWLSGLTVIARIQNVLAYAAGALLILAGARMLNLLPWRRKSSSGEPADRADGILPSIYRRFLVQPTAGGALALGLATGFLPCPVVVVFLLIAIQSGSMTAGMATMAALGVGTAWSLLLLGMSGQMVVQRLRRWGTFAPGVILILLGLATALRGTEAFHRILGCPASPASDSCSCAADSQMHRAD